MDPSEQSPIAKSCGACIERFDRLLLLFDGSQSEVQGIRSSEVVDARTRFQIWLGNLGARQTFSSQSSLDYRLRDAPKIGSQISELLDDLSEALEDVSSIISGERPNRTSSPLSSSDDGMDEEPLSEVQELFQMIPEAISSLFRLSIIIQRATPRDRFSKALASVKEPFDDSFDIAHVGSKFPRLDAKESQWLKQRLGNAITQRRQYLRYVREHREKKGKHERGSDVAQVQIGQPAIDLHRAASHPIRIESQSVLSNSKPASTLAPTAASTLAVAQLGDAERLSDDAVSKTSFATSVDESSSPNALRVPALTKFANLGTAFECPFCWTIQNFKRESTWRMHVFEDLKPYVCTFQACDVKLFADRNAWFEHELQSHHLQWRCPFCKHATSSSEEAFRTHLGEKHQNLFPVESLVALVQASQEAQENFSATSCPFCSDWEPILRKTNPNIPETETIMVTAKQFRNHLAKHMEQLALFAVPRGDNEKEEADSGDVAAGSVADASKDSEQPSSTSALSEDLDRFHSWLEDGLYEEVAHYVTTLQSDTPSHKLDAMLQHVVLTSGWDLQTLLMTTLLSRGADPNCRNHLGETPLHLATKNDDSTAIQYLLDHNAEITATDQLGRTSLHVAASSGYIAPARTLLEAGAGVSAQDYEQDTPLHLAVKHNRFRIVDVLLHGGAELEILDIHGFTPLSIAARNGNREIVIILLAAGAHWDITDSSGQSLLHETVSLGHTEVVECLCRYGANPNLLDRKQIAPIIVAASRNDQNMVDTLLQRGASFKAWRDAIPNYQDQSILPALDNLVSIFRGQGKHPEADEVQLAITKIEGGRYRGVEHPYFSGTRAKPVAPSGSQKLGPNAQTDSQLDLVYARGEAGHPVNRRYWTGLEEKQLALIEERKKTFGETDDRYLRALDMLGALYQDWASRIEMPFPETTAPAQDLQEVTRKMWDLALLLYKNGRRTRATEVMKDVLKHSQDPVVANGLGLPENLANLIQYDHQNGDSTSFALRCIAEGIKSRDPLGGAWQAGAEPKGSKLKEELDVARNADTDIPHTTLTYLEAAIESLWRRICSEPESYIMNSDEFSLFTYFRARYSQSPDDAIARKAFARYWNHFAPRSIDLRAARSSLPHRERSDASVPSDTELKEESNLREVLENIFRASVINSQLFDPFDSAGRPWHVRREENLSDTMKEVRQPKRTTDVAKARVKAMRCLWECICEDSDSFLMTPEHFELFNYFRKELSSEPLLTVAKIAVTRFWDSQHFENRQDAFFDPDFYKTMSSVGDIGELKQEQQQESEEKGKGKMKEEAVVAAASEGGKSSESDGGQSFKSDGEHSSRSGANEALLEDTQPPRAHTAQDSLKDLVQLTKVRHAKYLEELGDPNLSHKRREWLQKSANITLWTILRNVSEYVMSGQEYVIFKMFMGDEQYRNGLDGEIARKASARFWRSQFSGPGVDDGSDAEWRHRPNILLIGPSSSRLEKFEQMLPHFRITYLAPPESMISGILDKMDPKPDVVLLDVVLPQFDGLSTIEQLLDAATPVPIVAMLPPSAPINSSTWLLHGVMDVVWKEPVLERESNELRMVLLCYLLHLRKPPSTEPLESDPTDTSTTLQTHDRQLSPMLGQDKKMAIPPSPPERKYRRHPKPDENAPERPPSAYVIFSNKVRDELRTQKLSFTAIAKIVGERWQSLKPEDREQYESEAAVAKELYNSQLAKYKDTDQYQDYMQYLADFKARNVPKIADKKRVTEAKNAGSGSVASSFLTKKSSNLEHHRKDSLS